MRPTPGSSTALALDDDDQLDDDRRVTRRVPLSLFLNTYVEERLQRVMTSNVSIRGMHVHRVVGPRGTMRPLGREHRFVQVELPLPGTSDTIWARGEVRHDELELGEGLDGLVHGSGILLRDMARGHRRLLADFVADAVDGWRQERRRQSIAAIHGIVRATKTH